MTILVRIVMLLLALSFAACSRAPGPDAISNPPATGDCGFCHVIGVGSRRAVLGATGDFGGNSSLASHHITSGAGTDPSGEQCRVCHDLSAHTSGTIRLKNADTGAVIVYDPQNAASLEPFCLSCHDGNGATFTFVSGGTPTSPFNDGSVLGGLPPNLYQAGDKIAGYWNGSSNRHRSFGGLTCAGGGTPGTGCHGSGGRINMHGSTNAGLLTNSMNFQIPLVFDSTNPLSSYSYNNYRLCFDCHESYPAVDRYAVLGYKQGGNYDHPWAPTPYYTKDDGTPLTIQSLYRDRFISNPLQYPAYWSGVDQPYNDNSWLAQPVFTPAGAPVHAALHNYHLLGDSAITPGSVQLLGWQYRGDPGRVGRITCTACHNVHGTNVNGTFGDKCVPPTDPDFPNIESVRGTYDEFCFFRVNYPFAPAGTDVYRTLYPSVFDDTVFRAYPLNCTSSCHQSMGITSYWSSPADE